MPNSRLRPPVRAKSLTLTLALALAALCLAAPAALAAPGEVVMLGPTLTSGASNTLVQKFVAAGKTPVVKTAEEWAAMGAADFDAYDAVVLGDPDCRSLGPEAAATANAATWSPVVDGNVVVIGTDETSHLFDGALLIEKAAAFSVAEAGKTGAYISLSCYYGGTPAGTPVPLLSGFGDFTVRGVHNQCVNDDAHVVATHPALAGLTDAMLSYWDCSVHEVFDSWPLSFEVLAMTSDFGTSFTAPDGTVGTPYILARGVEVISDIKLSPKVATNDLGASHTVTATVTEPAPTEADPAAVAPVVGTTVTFTVIDGPHAGTTGTGVTDAAGKATFAYTGTKLGTDTIEATFMDARQRTQRSNRVTKTWVPLEVCGNGVDDDGDGAVDEGCPVPAAAVAAPVVAAVAVKPCTSVRKFTIRIRQRRGGKIRSATVLVNGKLVATVRGKRITAPVDLTGLPTGRFTVQITAVTTTGKKVSGVRQYFTCTAKKPGGVPKL